MLGWFHEEAWVHPPGLLLRFRSNSNGFFFPVGFRTVAACGGKRKNTHMGHPHGTPTWDCGGCLVGLFDGHQIVCVVVVVWCYVHFHNHFFPRNDRVALKLARPQNAWLSSDFGCCWASTDFNWNVSLVVCVVNLLTFKPSKHLEDVGAGLCVMMIFDFGG